VTTPNEIVAKKRRRCGAQPLVGSDFSIYSTSMVDFSDHNERKLWLAPRSNDIAVVLAARAALRVLPTVELKFGANRGRISRHNAVLRVFRAVASAWATAAYPGYRNKLSEAAQSALRGLADLQAPLPERAVVYAAAAAASEATDSDPRDYASTTIRYALDTAIGKGREAFEVTLAAIGADTDLLGQRFDPVTLAHSQLWAKRVPDWAKDAWAHLKEALLAVDEDWVVWTDWYEQRLLGREAHQDIEVARVTIPNGIWNQGPKVANGQIKALFEEHGILRYEIGDEAETPVDIAKLSLEEARVVGARAALRALPLLAVVAKRFDPQGRYALFMFRVVCFAWAVARFPSLEKTRTDLANILVNASKPPLGSTTALTNAVALAVSPSVVNGMSAEVFKNFTSGLQRLRSVSREFDGRAEDRVFELALKDDLNDLRDATSAQILTLPLWSGGSPPEWLARYWTDLKNDLIGAGVGWEVWVQWYENRLTGAVHSDVHELTYIAVPDEFWAYGPARVNAWILKQLEELGSTLFGKNIPEIPAPGPGPRFQVSESGPIERAPTQGFDESGNDVRTINQLKPLAQKCVLDLRARLSRNEFPELLGTIEQYDAALNPHSDRRVEWGEVWGLGVLLQNAASAAERKIADRPLPPLEDPAKTALDSLLALHGPLILATSDGAKLSARSQEFAMTRQQQADLRAASEQIVDQLNRSHDVITPSAAKSIANAINTINEGGHPERGTVYALATIKNVSIILIGAAAAATPAVIGELLGSTLLGAVFGAPITLVAVEMVKKNPAFNALVTQLGAQLDKMSDVELRNWLQERGRRFAPFRSFVISNEEPLRKIAQSTSELKWMLRYIDFVVGKK
jgi:hypothetical protein